MGWLKFGLALLLFAIFAALALGCKREPPDPREQSTLTCDDASRGTVVLHGIWWHAHDGAWWTDTARGMREYRQRATENCTAENIR